MAAPAPSRSTHRAPVAIVSAATLLVAAGVLTHGPASGLAIAGLLVALGGVLAVAFGGARWARIGDRRSAAAVAVLGLAVFVAGAVVESRTAATHLAPSSSEAVDD